MHWWTNWYPDCFEILNKFYCKFLKYSGPQYASKLPELVEEEGPIEDHSGGRTSKAEVRSWCTFSSHCNIGYAMQK